jgi:amino acid transporter
MSLAILWTAIGLNLLNPRHFKMVFWVTFGVIMLDYALTLIWLPIGVSKTYGFQSGSFFTTYQNGTNAPTGWNWCLSFLFTSGVLTGFDAAGHVAEETKNASVAAARGVFWSCVASGVLGTPVVFLFLACSVRAALLSRSCLTRAQPSIDTMYGFTAPQPFVQLYAAALGRGGQVFMTLVAVAGLWLNVAVCIVASSRLVYAIARDGILPGHKWIGKVRADGQPANAVLFIGMVGSLLLCTILPSPVAFTSLISAGAIPTIAAYALIAALRLFVTPGQLKFAKWSNGIFSKPFLWIALVWNRAVALLVEESD